MNAFPKNRPEVPSTEDAAFILGRCISLAGVVCITKISDITKSADFTERVGNSIVKAMNDNNINDKPTWDKLRNFVVAYLEALATELKT